MKLTVKELKKQIKEIPKEEKELQRQKPKWETYGVDTSKRK